MALSPSRARSLRLPGWLRKWTAPGPARRRLAIAALVLLALLPVLYVFDRTADARRNVVYWDEFDTALALILKLKEGQPADAFLKDLFAINNEHRMVTSRLLFATCYWLTGTINFTAIDFIGNATMFGLGALLIATAGSTLRRVRLAVLLSLALFQLEHYENYLWSGASIDHFQVVLLLAGAIVALSRGTPAAVLAGGFLGALATFTLAHGLAIWPIGAVMLWFARPRRGLVLWGAIAVFAIGGFFTGFRTNPSEKFVTLSVEGVRQVVHYWLSIIGAAPALGSSAWAPFLGVVLLLLLGYVMARGAIRRERVALPLAWCVIAAASLIAVGRAAESGGQVFSRYYVLSATAWALAIFMVLERHTHPRRPWQLLAPVLPTLLTFNVVANREFSDETDSWLECRNVAVVSYQQHGADGKGPFSLHPLPAHSTAMLAKAEQLGVYRLGSVCLPVAMPPRARESRRLSYYVDDLAVNGTAAIVRGWVGRAGQSLRSRQIHVILRRPRRHIFTTSTTCAPMSPAAQAHEKWVESGFRFQRRKWLPAQGEFPGRPPRLLRPSRRIHHDRAPPRHDRWPVGSQAERE
jgi:hypothetical protein